MTDQISAASTSLNYPHTKQESLTLNTRALKSEYINIYSGKLNLTSHSTTRALIEVVDQAIEKLDWPDESSINTLPPLLNKPSSDAFSVEEELCT